MIDIHSIILILLDFLCCLCFRNSSDPKSWFVYSKEWSWRWCFPRKYRASRRIDDNVIWCCFVLCGEVNAIILGWQQLGGIWRSFDYTGLSRFESILRRFLLTGALDISFNNIFFSLLISLLRLLLTSRWMTLVLLVMPKLDGVVWNSIIPIYEIEERDVEKFKKLITNSTYIQDIEKTYELKKR